ncbi:MAG: hypothetical protein ACYS0G_12385 [Planctomycetota bacterium]
MGDLRDRPPHGPHPHRVDQPNIAAPGGIIHDEVGQLQVAMKEASPDQLRDDIADRRTAAAAVGVASRSRAGQDQGGATGHVRQLQLHLRLPSAPGDPPTPDGRSGLDARPDQAPLCLELPLRLGDAHRQLHHEKG